MIKMIGAAMAAAAAIVFAAPAHADPDMASDVVVGESCAPGGPAFGYTSNGEVLACAYPGRWVNTAEWSGERTIGSACSGAGAAIAPDGRGLVCTNGQWMPGP